MSLLNRPGDGNRSVLTVIYKLLLQEGVLDYDRIIKLCAPEGIVEAKETRQTLNTWIDLGIFTKEADKVSINSEIKRAERDLIHLPRHARERVIKKENNERFLEIEDSKASDFCRACSWLLSQDVYTFDCNSWNEAEPFIKQQTRDSAHLIAQNDTRWSGFKDWAVYLGFACIGRFPKSGSLIIDPTNAIYKELDLIFGRTKTLTADQFLAKLSNQVPVLDDGEYRLIIEEELRKVSGENAWRSAPGGQLSTSLSRAILRLEVVGVLKCENKSDAPKRAILTGRNGSVINTFSHFTLIRN